MKKILFVAFTLLALVFATPADAQSRSGARKAPARTQAAPMTMNTFMNKWGGYYHKCCDGLMEYGWPKQFFLDMGKVMPNHFKMVKVGQQNGIVYHAFALILPNNYDVNVGAIGFKGTKLYSMEVNRWGLDEEYADQLSQQLEWDFDLSKP